MRWAAGTCTEGLVANGAVYAPGVGRSWIPIGRAWLILGAHVVWHGGGPRLGRCWRTSRQARSPHICQFRATILRDEDTSAGSLNLVRLRPKLALFQQLGGAIRPEKRVGCVALHFTCATGARPAHQDGPKTCRPRPNLAKPAPIWSPAGGRNHPDMVDADLGLVEPAAQLVNTSPK